MFQMYYYDHYGKSCLGLCSTANAGAQRHGGEISRLVFIEDCEPYDYFTVHEQADGFSDNEVVLFSAQTVEQCEAFIRFRDGVMGIVGQKFGQKFVNLWDD